MPGKPDEEEGPIAQLDDLDVDPEDDDAEGEEEDDDDAFDEE